MRCGPGAGYRNGYRTERLDSAEGRIEYPAERKKALLHLAPGTKETRASYREFFPTCGEVACSIRGW